MTFQSREFQALKKLASQATKGEVEIDSVKLGEILLTVIAEINRHNTVIDSIQMASAQAVARSGPPMSVGGY